MSSDILSIFNHTVSIESQGAEIVPIESLPENISKYFTTFCPCPFYKMKDESLIFGPLKIPSGSDPFFGTFFIDEKQYRLIRRRNVALAYCVMGEPFWPFLFSLYIQDMHYQTPRCKNCSSPTFYLDITSALVPGNNKIVLQIEHPQVENIYFVIKLFEKNSISSISQSIIEMPHFTFEDWNRLFHNTAPSDDGITSTVISLSRTCPLSLQNITCPVRGINCSHLAVFDLNSFLLFQLQSGDWTCPICSQDCRDLRVDDVLASIFQKLPENVEFVKVDINANATIVPPKCNSTITGESDSE